VEEQRLSKIEKDMAVVSESLLHISTTLEKMSDVHLDNKLLSGRFASMDRELADSFKRIHKRMDDVEKHMDQDKADRRAEKLVFLGFALSVVGLFIERIL